MLHFCYNQQKISRPVVESGYSLLIVEDDSTLRKELVEFLSDFFDTIMQSDNAEDGFDIFEKNNFDVLITDIQLPKSDGLSLVKKVKKRSPDQLIVVMSAYRDTEYFLRSIELGIFNFLLKPFTSQALMEMLFKVKKRLEENSKNHETPNTIELAENISYKVTSKILSIDGEEQKLTLKEDRLLFVLVKNMQSYLSDEQIALEVWGESSVASSTLRVLIKRLRDRLGYEDAIINLKGRGYRLNISQSL